MSWVVPWWVVHKTTAQETVGLQNAAIAAANNPANSFRRIRMSLQNGLIARLPLTKRRRGQTKFANLSSAKTPTAP